MSDDRESEEGRVARKLRDRKSGLVWAAGRRRGTLSAAGAGVAAAAAAVLWSGSAASQSQTCA